MENESTRGERDGRMLRGSWETGAGWGAGAGEANAKALVEALPRKAPPAVTPHHWSTIYTIHTFQRNPFPGRAMEGLLESQSTQSSLTAWNLSYLRRLSQSFKLPKTSVYSNKPVSVKLKPLFIKRRRGKGWATVESKACL